ncbi:MAG: hypothetical protein SFV15_25665 [Polyangiaceae bacterium]|nr:hypothetical protein [Polyangiaceae bacterium]
MQHPNWFRCLLFVPLILGCEEDVVCDDNPCVSGASVIFSPYLSEKGTYRIEAALDDGASVSCDIQVTDTLKAGDWKCSSEAAWVALRLESPSGSGAGGVASLGPNTRAIGIDSFGVRGSVTPLRISVTRDDRAIIEDSAPQWATENSSPAGCPACNSRTTKVAPR